MTGDSPRTECEQRSRGAVRCSRMLYGPSMEPCTNKTPTRARPVERPRRRGRRMTRPPANEAQTCLTPRSGKRRRAAARRNPALRKRHHCAANCPDVRRSTVPSDRKPRTRPNASLNQRAERSTERKTRFSWPHNGSGSPAAPRVRSGRGESHGFRRNAGSHPTARQTEAIG